MTTSSTGTGPGLGPAEGATLITRDLDHSTGIYAEHLGLRVSRRDALPDHEADALGWPSLAGTRYAWLANELGEPWLRLIEHPEAKSLAPFTHYGWLSLEIAVRDVDALGERLADSPFEIIGPPADLSMSDAIRAMQVVGPCGEVLYLTEVKREVPPFDLPFARCTVDRLFIPVMTCPDREAVLAHYEGLSGNEGLRFETRITVISAALGLDREHPHPVATLQLRDSTLIEIDQVPRLRPAPFGGDLPPMGIAEIHFRGAKLPTVRSCGAAGERYTLNAPLTG